MWFALYYSEKRPCEVSLGKQSIRQKGVELCATLAIVFLLLALQT
jgi:hypothetical protein